MQLKIKCVSIDDEPMALDIVNNYIKRIPFLELTASFISPIEAQNYLNNHPCDLVFIDINMPDLNGMQLLNTLSVQPLVIFTTAHSEFAIKSFDHNVIDYLLKPIEFSRFLKSSSKALNYFKNKSVEYVIDDNKNSLSPKKNNEAVFIQSGTKIHKVNVDSILFVKSDGNYVVFQTSDTKIMTLMNMGQVLQALPANSFYRIHKSYIVPIKHITEVERHQVKINNFKIPIGQIYREEFLKKFKS